MEEDMKKLVAGSVVLVAFFVIVIVGTTLLQNIKADTTNFILQSNTALNESGTVTAGATTFFVQANALQKVASINYVSNFSNDFHLPSTSYSLINHSAWNMTNTTFTGMKLNITYTYTRQLNTVAGNVTALGLGAMVQYSNWFVIIVIIVIMAVVITLLMKAFLSRGSGV